MTAYPQSSSKVSAAKHAATMRAGWPHLNGGTR